MVRKQKDKQKKDLKDLYKDGGRRFDDYVHNEEFPNPLEKAEIQRREEMERKKNMWKLWLEIPLFLAFIGVVWMVVPYHLQLHSKNGCEMTYIYKPMIFSPKVVRGNTVEKYTLFRYLEGDRDETIRDTDIPVLFIPGSSGSGKQVRSVATTLYNVTGQLTTPPKSRFVFFACDFNEEFSFLSGATLMRQREFVVRSMDTIIHLYAGTGVTKIILIGHSFGGTVLYSLPAHPKLDPKWMDLVITLGAPINGPPFMSDYYMELFYENTVRAWNTRADELKHVTLISYSGGIKDFMVPDHLARWPFKYTKDMEKIRGSRDGRIVFRPSWSLREVACPVDHNCLAWCNQLLRHISTLMIKYESEWKLPKDGVMKGSRQVVKEFFQSRRPETRMPASEDPRPLFNNSWFIQEERRNITMTETHPNVVMNLDVMLHDLVVYIRTKPVKCPDGVTATHANLTFRSMENFTTYSSKQGDWMYMYVMPAFPETRRLKGVLRIGGTPNCQYEMHADIHVYGTLYRRLLDSTNLPFVIFYTLFVCAILPVIKRNRMPTSVVDFYKAVPDWLANGIFTSGVCLAALFVATYRNYFEKYGISSIMWIAGTRLATFIISRLLQPLLGLISRFVERRGPKLRGFFRLFLSMLSLMMASNNLALGYAFILLLILFKVGPHSKNGLMFIVFSISILVSIGLAGNVRDGPTGVFQRSIRGLSPNGYAEAFFNIFYEYLHPLLPPFIISVFCFLLNLSQMLKTVDNLTKESILAVFYCLLLSSLCFVSNVESMAVVSTFYFLLFETMKEYKGLTASNGKKID